MFSKYIESAIYSVYVYTMYGFQTLEYLKIMFSSLSKVGVFSLYLNLRKHI